ncbi:hypothetical protein PV11_07165 [Exophiala sideris]|uniref:Uncharacterized protein n=1 Tax=Exophiala sideris TaxID=1016849 RepID=A0A0D1YFG7_9EURO|nr:hypothetical protein PV11_07165 [Exophiala sideris]
MADDIPRPNKSVIIESKEVQDGDWNAQTFFPFQEDQERQQIQIDQHAASFPKLGLGALIGALTLIALSGAMLLVVQGPAKVVSDWTVHVYKTHRYVTIPKPAAWLSGILSGISVCFHIALAEGLNIAWWYHVRQRSATVRDLHNIWNHGTSTWNVVTSGVKDMKNGLVGLTRRVAHRDAERQPYSDRKHFSYVALATLFVATIPLNGFLLQNAVVVSLEPASKNGTIIVPMLSADSFGSLGGQIGVQAAGDMYGGGVYDWSPMLGNLSQSISTKVIPTVNLGTYNTTCLGSCKTNVQGMGFRIQCNDTEKAYDIPEYVNDADDPTLAGMIANGTDVATVAITYNYTNTNRITMRSMWKNSNTCQGNFSIQTCHFDLATVDYPVVINSGVQEATADGGLRNITTMTLGLNLLTESPKVVTMATSEYIANTLDTHFAVAGLAGLFAQTLNSSINLRYDFSQNGLGYGTSAEGLFGWQQLGSSWTNAWPICESTVGNVSQQALAVVQSMTFQMGAYNWLSSWGSGDPNYYGGTDANETVAQALEKNTPRPLAVQAYQRNEYRVVWPWYFGAMTVTLAVSLFILPTFWGYWRLERRTTMSPFETARAFHAPILYQQDSTIPSKDLIKRVGDVQIHRDLPDLPVAATGMAVGRAVSG